MNKYPNTVITKEDIQKAMISASQMDSDTLEKTLYESADYVGILKNDDNALESFLTDGANKDKVVMHCTLCCIFKYKSDPNLVDKILDDYNYILKTLTTQ
jgi:hypothetical protein